MKAAPRGRRLGWPGRGCPSFAPFHIEPGASLQLIGVPPSSCFFFRPDRALNHCPPLLPFHLLLLSSLINVPDLSINMAT